jgi:hypothetical protein
MRTDIAKLTGAFLQLFVVNEPKKGSDIFQNTAQKLNLALILSLDYSEVSRD